MKDDARFWKKLCFVLIAALVILTCVSAYYGLGEADLGDVCAELDDINTTLKLIYYAIS